MAPRGGRSAAASFSSFPTTPGDTKQLGGMRKARGKRQPGSWGMRAGQEKRGGVLALGKARCKVGFDAWSLEIGQTEALAEQELCCETCSGERVFWEEIII